MRSHVFSLCPDSHCAHEQFQNSYFARQSENSHFAQDNSGIVSILTLRKTYIMLKPTLNSNANKKIYYRDGHRDTTQFWC